MNDTGWADRALGDITSFEYGAPLPASSRVGDGFPVFGSNGEVGRNRSALVRGPGIIIGRKGTVGALAWSSGDFWPIDTAYFAQPRSGISMRWLYWAMSNLGLNLLDSSTGVPGLNRNDAYRLRVRVPSLEQQRRVAQILDAIDDKIYATELIIRKLDQVREGLLAASLAHAANQGSLGHLVPLRDLASVTVGYVGPTNPFYTSPERGVLFLRTGNIGPSGLTFDNSRWVTESFHKSQPKSSLRAGDVLVSRVGYTGMAAVVPDIGPANCANMIIIRVGSGVRPDWIRLLFESENYRRQVAAFTAGSAQPVLNIGLVERLATPVVNLERQDRVIAALKAHDDRRRSEETLRAKLMLTKSGLASDLLGGHVRAPKEAAT